MNIFKKAYIEFKIRRQRAIIGKVTKKLQRQVKLDPSLGEKEVSEEHKKIMESVLKNIIAYKSQLNQSYAQEEKYLQELNK